MAWMVALALCPFDGCPVNFERMPARFVRRISGMHGSDRLARLLAPMGDGDVNPDGGHTIRGGGGEIKCNVRGAGRARRVGRVSEGECKGCSIHGFEGGFCAFSKSRSANLMWDSPRRERDSPNKDRRTVTNALLTTIHVIQQACR
jgi:hypothetical protein